MPRGTARVKATNLVFFTGGQEIRRKNITSELLVSC
jgi:hypothetical protein